MNIKAFGYVNEVSAMKVLCSEVGGIGETCEHRRESILVAARVNPNCCQDLFSNILILFR